MTSTPSKLDSLLDSSILLGFSKVGAGIRRLPAVSTSMAGKRVVITGATGGIGKAAADALGRLEAEVVLVGRNPDKLDVAAADVTRMGGTAITEVADLSLMADVMALAGRLASRFDRVDALINNVGILHPERQVTPEGLEATFATNLLGQFILTNHLAPTLAAAAHPARIITVSSGGMYTARLSADDLQSTRSYRGSVAYARSKRAQVVLTEMWAERFASPRIVAHSMHPGWADTPGVGHSLPTFAKLTAPILRTPEQGADTIVWLAADPEPAGSTGLFWHDRAPRPTHRLRSTGERPGERQRLWEALESMASDFEAHATDPTIR
jgi:dehydrogenase/reductase SDR family member 12